MSPEHSQELIDAFPALFPSGSFYFECGDGWFPLLKECILGLKKEIENNPLDLDPDFLFYVTQVKEKFGTLRFYTSLSFERFDDLIDKAEKDSGSICEICGEPGLRIKECGWLMTRCLNCHCPSPEEA
jgi:hypothetical protein